MANDTINCTYSVWLGRVEICGLLGGRSRDGGGRSADGKDTFLSGLLLGTLQ